MLKFFHISYFFIGILFFPFSIWGQSILRVEEAIQIALEQNLGIQIAQLEQTAQEMQVYKANAGMGPTVDWIANLNLTGNNANQKFLDGREVNRFGRAYSPNTSLVAGMVLYDGGRMQAIYDRLSLMSEYSALETKVLMQNTVAEVLSAYYNIVRQKETVNYLNTILKYHNERLTITEERWKIGKGSKLDFLQSKTVMNAQLSELATAKNNLRNAKVVLNGLLNRDPYLDFDTENLAHTEKEYQLSQLLEIAKTKNRDILLLQKSLDISRKREEELEAARKPEVSTDGVLSYNYSNTTTGFLTSSRTISARIGLSARWNLFDGNHRKNQIAISKVNSAIIEKQQEELLQAITNELTFAYNKYIADRELLLFEEENKMIAEESLAISIEKFRLGGSTILELNEAQRVYDTALNRLVNAQYNVKISQLALLQLSGTLLEEN